MHPRICADFQYSRSIPTAAEFGHDRFMKKPLATFVINNAEELQEAILLSLMYVSATGSKARHPACVVISGADRLTVEEETLSDKSIVYNIRFHEATAAQRKAERS